MQEIQNNGIRIYSGEIDEDDDNPEIKEMRVSKSVCLFKIKCVWHHTLLLLKERYDVALIFL